MPDLLNYGLKTLLGSIYQLIGNTPFIKLVKISSILNVDIYVKVNMDEF